MCMHKKNLWCHISQFSSVLVCGYTKLGFYMYLYILNAHLACALLSSAFNLLINQTMCQYGGVSIYNCASV